MENKEIKCGYTNVEYKSEVDSAPILRIDFEIIALKIKIDPEAGARFLSEKLGEYLTIINQ